MIVVLRPPRGEPLEVAFVGRGEERKIPHPHGDVVLRREGDIALLLTGELPHIVRKKINLTGVLLELVPVEEMAGDPWELERLVYSPGISPRVRRFLRLLAALSSLKGEAVYPESVREGLLLLAHRMLGLDLETVVERREELVRELKEELERVLSEMSREELLWIVRELVLKRSGRR